ncbi:MAG: vanadium-dependent haloperoxidase [Myxococcota bacterium]
MVNPSCDQPYLWARPPFKSYAVLPWGRALRPYRNQADQVLEVSATLTDEQKMVSELFDDKISSLGFSILFLTLSRGLSVEQFVQLDYAVNVAAFDTMITIWANKRHYDAVRPFSAIRYLYGDEELVAWGGPGQGTVDDILSSEWRPYLQSANHPEYPSASASFCRAHATAATLYMGGDNSLGWQVPYPAGSSVVEPGITPAQDIVLSYDTWDDFSHDCGISRLWAGVHFYDSIPAGQALGDPIGQRAYEFVDAHIRGDRDAIEEF